MKTIGNKLSYKSIQRIQFTLHPSFILLVFFYLTIIIYLSEINSLCPL